MTRRHAVKTMILLAAMLAAIASASSSHATVWTAYPAPDSSQYGFQEALDLAQPGDTVELMPGRYDQFTKVSQLGSNSWTYIGLVQVPDVALRSATPELAVIGPSTETGQVGGHLTVGLGVDAGATGLTVDSVKIENMTWGISGLESVSVDNCEFGLTPPGSAAIVTTGNNSLTLTSSLFMPGSKLFIFNDAAGGEIRIDDCTFSGSPISSGIGSAATTLTITNSKFDIAGSLLLSGGISATATDCNFGPVSTNSILLNGASFYAEDCTFIVGSASVAQVSSLASFRAHRCHFESGGTAVMFLVNFSTLEITDSNILHASNDYVSAWVPKSNNQPVRLTNNFWSEGSEAEIRQYIRDGSTFGDSTLVTAEILPIRNQQVVPIEKKSVGSLKALFADPK